MKRKNRIKWETSPFGWDGISGVYCICVCQDDKTQIHYIGSSKNIGKRVSTENHPYKKVLQKHDFVYIKFKECSNYVELEKRLIFKLKPILNKRGK